MKPRNSIPRGVVSGGAQGAVFAVVVTVNYQCRSNINEIETRIAAVATSTDNAAT